MVSRHFLYKLGDMDELRRFILESDFDPRFARAVYESLGMLEAVNINKDFLAREAGSPEKFAEARKAVQDVWKSEGMDSQLNQKTAQRVLNILYLMEIRKPGFTTADKLHSIHDLQLHNMLDTKFLNAVNSDSTPEQAEEALQNAVAHQVQQQKAYPDLTAEEEAVWNRVRVYHEFPDGFRWVYAVDANGKIASYIPSEITGKTMNHCGNSPRANSDDQYWELRDADGKAYLTVILNKDGQLEESKSWGNQVNKYRRQIQPYVKWFLKDKVTGVGPRYDYGYSTHTNYGVKDFIGDDPEFIEYVTEFKPELLGNTEEKILFWHGALEAGVVTKEQMKQMLVQDLEIDALLANEEFGRYARTSRFKYDKSGSMYSSNVFGNNRFEVLCAACDGCPFTDEELRERILDRSIGLDEFVNYDIHLLTPEMQRVFVEADEDNFNKILSLAREVASFKVSDTLVDGLIEPLRKGPADTWHRLFVYLVEANPPEKVKPIVHEVLEDDTLMKNIFDGIGPDDEWRMRRIFPLIIDIYKRFGDISLVQIVKDRFAGYANLSQQPGIIGTWQRITAVTNTVGGALDCPAKIRDALIGCIPVSQVVTMVSPRKDDDFDDSMTLTCIGAKLMKLYGQEYACTKFSKEQSRFLYMLNLAKEGIEVYGLDDIVPMVTRHIKMVQLPNKHGRDDLCMYMLGLSARPEICASLKPGELSIFMCICKMHGPWSIFEKECSPAIIDAFLADLDLVNGHPNRDFILQLAEQSLFDLLALLAGMTQNPLMGKVAADSLYLRATIVGHFDDSRLWNDDYSIVDLIYNGTIKFPVEDWPSWAKALDSCRFVTWFLAAMNPDRLYSDEHAMGCLIRYVTGHDMFCTEEELAVPGKDESVNSSIDRMIGGMFRYSHRTSTRTSKVIAARLSPMVEDEKVGMSFNVLKTLGAAGMIHPRAYRKAMENSVASAEGQPAGDARISANEVWRLIRSPMLPSLICSTLTADFETYSKHRLGKDNEYADEWKCSSSIQSLSYKMYEKRAYYQIMRSVQKLEETGVLARMCAFAARLSKALWSDAAPSERWKGFGYKYDWSHANAVVHGIDRLKRMSDDYKKNPVPEPASKTRKRKASDGKVA